MNGLRPTDKTRWRQALSATSSRIPQDTTTTLPTQETQGAARTAPHKNINMPKKPKEKKRDKKQVKKFTRKAAGHKQKQEHGE